MAAAFAFPPSSMGWISAALGLIVITNLSLLAAERQRLCIRIIALQGIVLGFMPLLAHTGTVDAHLVGMACIFLAIKGVALPLLLRRAYLRLPPQPPSKAYLSNTACVFTGLTGYVFSLWLGTNLGVAANPLFTVFFPAAIATVFSGLLLIVTRRRALTQLFGYLVMENGLYLLGVPMAQADAVWLELTILLDILVGAFVMGIAIHHIHQAVQSIDVEQMASLRD